MARKRLDGEKLKQRFQEEHGCPLPTLSPNPSYQQKVLARSGPPSDDSGPAEAQRVRAWVEDLRPWIDRQRLPERQVEAIHDLVDALGPIASRLQAGDTELPEALTEAHLKVMAKLARAFGADLTGTRTVRIKGTCPPGIDQAVSNWVLTHRSLGSKNALRTVSHGLETGIRRGYTHEEFDVLTRVREQRRAQGVEKDTRIRWGQIQRSVRKTYPEGRAKLDGLLTGSVENFTKWIIRHGDGFLEELPNRSDVRDASSRPESDRRCDVCHVNRVRGAVTLVRVVSKAMDREIIIHACQDCTADEVRVAAGALGFGGGMIMQSAFRTHRQGAGRVQHAPGLKHEPCPVLKTGGDR